MRGWSLKQGYNFSYEQLFMDCDLYDVMQLTTEGIIFDTVTLALGVIDHVGPNNHYMTESHTLRHMHGIWQPTVIDRNNYTDWVDAGKKSSFEYARENAKAILENYQLVPLAADDAIQEIIEEYSKVGGI